MRLNAGELQRGERPGLETDANAPPAKNEAKRHDQRDSSPFTIPTAPAATEQSRREESKSEQKQANADDFDSGAGDPEIALLAREFLANARSQFPAPATAIEHELERLLDVLPDKDAGTKGVLGSFGLPPAALAAAREAVLDPPTRLRSPAGYAVTLLRRWRDEGRYP